LTKNPKPSNQCAAVMPSRTNGFQLRTATFATRIGAWWNCA
jgi:hypothetical protein